MNAALAKKNFDYCADTIELKSQIEMSFVELGKRLYEIREGKMYEPNYPTFEEFVKELKISPAMASKLANIWQKFVLEYGVKPKQLVDAGGWTVVAETLPMVRNKRSATFWLSKATSLPRSDLRRELNEKRTGIAPEDCLHDLDYYTLKICRVCGERIPQ